MATGRRTIAVAETVRPDAILVDHVAFGATVGLRAAGIPYADVVLGHPTQLPVAAETFGVPSSWPAAFEPDVAALPSLRDLARGVASRFTAEYNDAMRTISPTAPTTTDAFNAHGSIVLLNYPEALHDRARTGALPESHAFLGAALRFEDAGEAEGWLDLDLDRPIVLVSLGTFLSARDDVLAPVADALRQLDVRVAIATGAADLRSLGPLPGDWFVRAYLPQVAVLERAAAFVTHGGNNSVTEAASLGVPMLVMPFSTDQFDGASAIESSGLGLAADPNIATAAESGRSSTASSNRLRRAWPCSRRSSPPGQGRQRLSPPSRHCRKGSRRWALRSGPDQRRSHRRISSTTQAHLYRSRDGPDRPARRDRDSTVRSVA